MKAQEMSTLIKKNLNTLIEELVAFFGEEHREYITTRIKTCKIFIYDNDYAQVDRIQFVDVGEIAYDSATIMLNALHIPFLETPNNDSSDDLMYPAYSHQLCNDLGKILFDFIDANKETITVSELKEAIKEVHSEEIDKLKLTEDQYQLMTKTYVDIFRQSDLLECKKKLVLALENKKEYEELIYLYKAKFVRESLFCGSDNVEQIWDLFVECATSTSPNKARRKLSSRMAAIKPINDDLKADSQYYYDKILTKAFCKEKMGEYEAYVKAQYNTFFGVRKTGMFNDLSNNFSSFNMATVEDYTSSSLILGFHAPSINKVGEEEPFVVINNIRKLYDLKFASDTVVHELIHHLGGVNERNGKLGFCYYDMLLNDRLEEAYVNYIAKTINLKMLESLELDNKEFFFEKADGRPTSSDASMEFMKTLIEENKELLFKVHTSATLTREEADDLIKLTQLNYMINDIEAASLKNRKEVTKEKLKEYHALMKKKKVSK